MISSQQGEKRKFPRASVRFVVVYSITEQDDIIRNDISQTKNLSASGALVTTDRPFNPNVPLLVKIRVPTSLEPLVFQARVVESKEVTRYSLYETRLEFVNVNEKERQIMADTVNFHLKKAAAKE